MGVDESFTTPATVPFKWEIKPGVPKHQHKQHYTNQIHNHHHPPPPPQKLKPPPGGLYSISHLEAQNNSFRSSPRTGSDYWRFRHSTMTISENVSAGCFPSPLLKRKPSKRVVHIKPELDYSSDLDQSSSRWSISSRKSISPFRDSLSSSPSTYSSYQSSPRPVSDAEWAGFALF